MPAGRYASIQNPRQYRALRKRGYSKEEAARISNAQTPGTRVKEAIPPHGPVALFNVPGAGPAVSRRLRRLKADQIAGNLCRGEDGGFQACDGNGGSAAGREADKLNRAAERDKKREARERALANEKDPKKRRALREQFRKEAQAERAAERERQAAERVTAAEARDKKRAEREAKRAEREAKRAEAKKKREEAKRAEKPKKGGGGGGGGSNDEPKMADPAAIEALRRRLGLKAKGGMGDAERRAMFAKMGKRGSAWKRNPETGKRTPTEAQARDAKRRAIQGAAPTPKQRAAYIKREGNAAERDVRKRYAADQNLDGSYSLLDSTRRSSAGTRTTVASGDKAKVDRELDQRARAARTRAEREAANRVDTVLSDIRGGFYDDVTPSDAKRDFGKFKAMRPKRKLLRRKVYAEAKAAGLSTADARARASEALRRDTAERARRSYERATLAVFKDAAGRDRWAAISSTAYRDKDGEIVSRKALAGAVAVADAEGARGPLRFWHVPGLDLGDCDYQAVTDDGRFLLESGTFRSPAYARALKAARPWQISIGFTHPPTEPDPGGVFHHIRIFERSLVPQGRASNRFTAITTKESRMLPPEKLKALETLLGADGAQQLVSQAQATAKAADAAGVAYKSTDAPTVYTGPDGQPGVIVGGAWVALKAVAPMPPEQMLEAAATETMDAEAELAEDAEPLGDDTDLMDLTVADFRSLMAAALEEVIGGVSAKMADMKAQYEAMGKAFGTMQQTKDDAAAAQAAELQALKESKAALESQVQALDTRLKELEGDQPTLKPFKASESAATVVAPPAALKAAPGNPAESAYAMIFGEAPQYPIS